MKYIQAEYCFTWRKYLHQALKKGDEYRDPAETICINITDSPIFGCLRYHSTDKQVKELIG